MLNACDTRLARNAAYVDFSSSVNVSIGEPIGAADEVMLEMLILMLMLVQRC